MYEIRQQQRKQMREHRFFYHFILVIGIFVFSQGCSLMSKSTGYAATAAILGIMLHRHSVDKVLESIFKISPHKNAKNLMIIALALIGIFSYFVRLGYILFLLLDLASIILYAIVAFISSKSKKEQE